MRSPFMRGVIGILGILGTSVCSGCAGSTFLYGEEAPEGEFPTLQSVPEPPTLTSQKYFDDESSRLEKNHDQALQAAQTLRSEESL